ncbi:MAG TPA: preprotein translocase subunit SecA [Bryobacteraceae bacterium]|nr:preprotein translocase subunit SecA [Bryobacteraceae bacterium]HUO31641.1 preprotein translocase subunit SecA [Bryobacteraceae bacterium]
MLDKTLAKIFGTRNEREVKRLRPLIAAINDLEPQLQQLSDADLTQKTQEFKQRITNGEPLDDLLIESFAVCREAGRRVLNMRHFDVQLIGGIVLHRGKIAEMRTGEGKTLVATLPVYLNALSGEGVHVVTVNDYLAKRDAEWMGRIYKSLGLTVGIIVHDLDDDERRESYACDITYGTNNEYGFDYLRDNMKFRLEHCVQRGHHFAIVDEVDSILVDEARTPLIISGPSEESTDKYYRINGIIPKLVRGEEIKGKEPGETYTTGDYTVDEKYRSAGLTEEGTFKVEKLLNMPGLFESAQLESWIIRHHVEQALKAHVLFQRDKDYLVKDGEVIIVDEFTGRVMPGRRWSDGLHQAVEAKEGVKIERENQTLATITFQNYFRLYKKLAGMTGTAETEAAEFNKTYKLDVVVIPTNRPMLRKEFQDVVYRTAEEKFRNAAKSIKEFNERGQPVLVGTISVEKSEKLSSQLKKMGVKHEVLNAKNHEREAFIIAQAGRKNAVTVSTNMAGRGTDILLGGNPEFLTKEHLKKQNKDPDALQTAAVGSPERAEWDEVFARYRAETAVEHDEVVAAGGLHVLGTERHESRRIDNQLRGRAGRQGDPGSSRFYLSLQDDLMRIFGGERMQKLMLHLGMEEDVPIESRLITKRIASAQEAVEAQHFASRKHLLEYDDVMNKQRQAVYGMRRALLEGKDQRERVTEIIQGIVASSIDQRCPEREHITNYDLAGLQSDILTQFGVKVDPQELNGLLRQEIEDHINDLLERRYKEKEDLIGPEHMREAERIVMLNVIDNQWKDHLLSMDHLKEGIGLRGYGQKDPLIEYKKESFSLFQDMMDRIEDEAIRYLFFLQVTTGDPGGSGLGGQAKPILPFAEDEDEEEEEDEEQLVGASNEQRLAAQTAVTDFTRNIQRKKDKEMAELQFAGGNGGATTEKKQAVSAKKAGRNDPCPCGSGKKYKKCCGA